MNEGLIPRRYAKALYEVASESSQETSLYALMKSLLHEADANPALKRTLANPYVAAADKDTLLSTAAGASDADTVFARWLGLLAANRRYGMAPEIARAYIRCYRDEKNIYPVTVTSATPLRQPESDRIKALIQTHIGDATMEYAERIDPALIGGFAIDIASERLDASVRNTLEQMRLQLTKK
ncbi:MAG: ATP synthase F1 subunit delta [Muribaculaceae bacterium]|nr:ATP synthase F1 subunit delta [Muribaculaceae bacterium]